VHVETSTTLKPGDFYRGGDGVFATDGLVVTKEVAYRPSYFDDTFHSVMRVSFARTYGTSEAPPRLTLDFGKMVDTDVRTLASCITDDCPDALYKVPTILLKLQPSALDKYLQPNMTATNFYDAFRDAVLDSWKAPVRGILSFTEANVQEYTTEYVLLNRLVIDLADPRGPWIRPDVSQTPVVVRVVTPGTGDEHWVVLNPYTTDVTVETDLSYLPIGVGKIGGSINLFDKYLAPQIAAGLSGNIHDTLRNLDRAANTALRDALAPVTNLIGGP
jgi:hypothetical protein